MPNIYKYKIYEFKKSRELQLIHSVEMKVLTIVSKTII